LNTLWRNWLNFFKLEDIQMELLLIRSCVGFPKFNFALRTCHPDKIKDAMNAFENMMRNRLEFMIGSRLENWQRELSHLKCKYGGIGIPMVEKIAWSAYTGSLCQTYELQNKILFGKFDTGVAKSRLFAVTFAFMEWKTQYATKAKISIDDVLNSKQPQFFLSKYVNEKVREDLLAKHDLEIHHRILLQRCSDDTANWTRALPLPWIGLAMTNGEYRTALQFHLGINVYNKQGVCSCKSKFPQISDKFGVHDTFCTKGGRLVARHDRVRDLIYNEAKGVNISCEMEANNLLDNRDRPADILFANIPGYRRRVCLDVTIVNAFQENPLEKAIAAKKKKYMERLTRENLDLVVLAIDSLGNVHPECLPVVRFIGSKIAEKEGITEAEATSRLKQRIIFKSVQFTAAAIMDRHLV